MRICNTAAFLFYLGGWNTHIWERKLTLNDYITIFLVCKQPWYPNDTRWTAILPTVGNKCIFKLFQSLKDFFCPSNKRSRTSFLQRQNGTFEEQPSSSGQPSILQSLGKQPLGVVISKTSKDHVYVATILTKSNGFLLEPSISNFSFWGAEGVDILRPTVSKPSCQMSSYCGGNWLPGVYSSINLSFQTK